LAQGVAEFEKKLAAEKQALVQTVREFARERETYFQRVEAEVVGLAVAIARKILHREARLTPCFWPESCASGSTTSPPGHVSA
jgi:flagellar biosynthesis/type III secretory pathway protein FliH